jgi:hypothetical protein
VQTEMTASRYPTGAGTRAPKGPHREGGRSDAGGEVFGRGEFGPHPWLIATPSVQTYYFARVFGFSCAGSGLRCSTWSRKRLVNCAKRASCPMRNSIVFDMTGARRNPGRHRFRAASASVACGCRSGNPRQITDEVRPDRRIDVHLGGEVRIHLLFHECGMKVAGIDDDQPKCRTSRRAVPRPVSGRAFWGRGHRAARRRRG